MTEKYSNNKFYLVAILTGSDAATSVHSKEPSTLRGSFKCLSLNLRSIVRLVYIMCDVEMRRQDKMEERQKNEDQYKSNHDKKSKKKK
jgi:hypothetical protein